VEVGERLKLITLGAEEIVTREELEKLVEEKEHLRVYVGYEPSGKIHLGHMLSVNKLREMQEAGLEVVVLLADLHAHLNQKGSLEEIKKVAEYNKECFIALGLDPKETEFVLGSKIQFTEDYLLDVQRLALQTTLLRARRSMDMVSKEDENPKVARVIYPLMQVADMIALDVDIAVGGIDQRKIHMLARDNLPKIGLKSPLFIHLPIIHGLDGDEKMSSSKENFISIDDAPEVIAKKMNKAYCPAQGVEANPVLEIFEHHVFRHNDSVLVEREERFGGDVNFKGYKALKDAYERGEVHPQDLKVTCANYMEKILAPARAHLQSCGYGKGIQ